jgi:hypothetical protein
LTPQSVTCTPGAAFIADFVNHGLTSFAITSLNRLSNRAFSSPCLVVVVLPYQPSSLRGRLGARVVSPELPVMGEQRPDDARVLVGHRHRRDILVSPVDHGVDPAARVSFVLRAVDHRTCPMDQQGSEIGSGLIRHSTLTQLAMPPKVGASIPLATDSAQLHGGGPDERRAPGAPIIPRQGLRAGPHPAVHVIEHSPAQVQPLNSSTMAHHTVLSKRF